MINTVNSDNLEDTVKQSFSISNRHANKLSLNSMVLAGAESAIDDLMVGVDNGTGMLD